VENNGEQSSREILFPTRLGQRQLEKESENSSRLSTEISRALKETHMRPEHWISTIPLRLRSLFRRRQADQELDQELRYHVKQKTAQNLAKGMSPQEARRAALLEMGGIEKRKEECRDTRRVTWLQDLIQDLRYGLRMFQKSPGFSAVVVFTLALGIGANTAIFSIVDAVLLRPLPYSQPDRLVFLMEQRPPEEMDISISFPDFEDWRAMNTVFESIGAYRLASVVMTGRGDPENLKMREVTSDLFPTLGVQPVLGRSLTPDDDKVGAVPVVLLSDSLWSRKFGRDTSVIGQRLTLDGESYTIIGVVPTSRFHASWRAMSLFSSLGRHEDEFGGPAKRDSHPGIYAYARMRPGVTLAEARAQMQDIAARLAKQYPQSNTGIGGAVDLLLSSIVGDVRPELIVLLGAVGLVLLIACANVANLLLGRSASRRREIAVRIALGAGRLRLMRQLLTESTLIAIAGGAAALIITFWATSVAVGSASASIPRIEDVSVDRWVLAYTLGISLVTGILFGILPAWQLTHTDVNESIKEGGRSGSAGTGRRRVRSALIVSEIAISMVLLVSASLMIKSLYRLLQADPGFDPTQVLTAVFSLPENHYKEPSKQRQFVQQLVDEISRTPGVQAAGLENPLLGGWQTGYIIEGQPLSKTGQDQSTDITRITPDSLLAMHVRLIRGRFFTPQDIDAAPQVCIVDTTLAKLVWPNENPLGKRMAVRAENNDPKKPIWMSVVGVVAHVKNYGVDKPSRVETYIPYAQDPVGGGSLAVRSSVDPTSLAATIRAAMKSLDPDVPLSQVRELSSITEESVAPRRFSVLLLAAFAALALLLAAVGIYGVMAFTVTQRSHEIGIRVALGAHPHDVLRMVIRDAIVLAGAGIVIGIAGTLAATRFLASLLFEIKPTDPVTFVGVVILLMLVALLACYVPARRAMRVDPMVALRHE
jgi:predicted permease